MAPYAWTGGALAANAVITAVQLDEIRTELSQPRYNIPAGLIAAIPVVSAGDTVLASHIAALRTAADAMACNCNCLWVNGACGGGACAADEYLQTWTCMPAGCQPANTQCGGNCNVNPCTNGIEDTALGETGIDCGGPCPACPVCGVAGATCFDGIQNQGETSTDCGGNCCIPCPTCADGVQNQGETGVDCGGPCAGCVAACEDGNSSNNTPYIEMSDGSCCGPCYVPYETPGNCHRFPASGSGFPTWNENDTCLPSCGVRGNGNASCCPPASCAPGDDAGPTWDCKSCCYNGCTVAPTCSDGIQNQNETGVDCGGFCPACTCSDPDAMCTQWLNETCAGVPCALGVMRQACISPPVCNGARRCNGGCSSCSPDCNLYCWDQGWDCNNGSCSDGCGGDCCGGGGGGGGGGSGVCPGGCDSCCSSWSGVGDCGTNGCAGNQRSRTRTCPPTAGCSEIDCWFDGSGCEAYFCNNDNVCDGTENCTCGDCNTQPACGGTGG